MAVTVEQARSTLPELLDRIVAGEEIIITRDQAPVARLVAAALNDEANPSRPAPRPVRVMGTLQTVGADNRSVTLRLNDGKNVLVNFTNGELENFPAQLGQSLAADGVAHFDASGELLRGEANMLRPAAATDDFFRRMPRAAMLPVNLTEIGRRNTEALRNIIGKWPGDETDEQIEQALREIS